MNYYYCGSLISFACKLQDVGWVNSKRHPNCHILPRLLSILKFCDREIVQIGARVLAIFSISVRDQVDEIVNLSMPTTEWGEGPPQVWGQWKIIISMRCSLRDGHFQFSISKPHQMRGLEHTLRRLGQLRPFKSYRDVRLGVACRH